MARLSGDTPPLLIDTRSPDEYSGKRQKSGAATAGRIPNSHAINWTNCVNYNSDKKFKSVNQLRTIYQEIIPNKDTQIIAYCHTGVRSAHTIFVLKELLGYSHVKNYDGSWTEWSYFNDTPKAQDSITTIFN